MVKFSTDQKSIIDKKDLIGYLAHKYLPFLFTELLSTWWLSLCLQISLEEVCFFLTYLIPFEPLFTNFIGRRLFFLDLPHSS